MARRRAIRLPTNSDRHPPSLLAQSYRTLRRVHGLSDLSRWVLTSFPLAPGRLPLRIRPVLVLLTGVVLLLLALLGFHPTLAAHLAPPHVPFSDKVLHFVCFGFATALFYACWVVDEPARRVWLWRHFHLLATLTVCVFLGGIGSEFVQSLLPYKTFQVGDVLANLLGSGIALVLCAQTARQHRHAAELRALYSALDEMPSDDDEADEQGVEYEYEGQEDEERSAGRADHLLRRPTLNMEERRPSTRAAASRARRQEQNPWSADDDGLFGLGEEDDDPDDDDAPGETRREGAGAGTGAGKAVTPGGSEPVPASKPARGDNNHDNGAVVVSPLGPTE